MDLELSLVIARLLRSTRLVFSKAPFFITSECEKGKKSCRISSFDMFDCQNLHDIEKKKRNGPKEGTLFKFLLPRASFGGRIDFDTFFQMPFRGANLETAWPLQPQMA